MRKKTILLLGLVLHVILLSAQNSFEFIIEDTLSSSCTSTFKDNQNFFVSLGVSGSPNLYEFNAMLIRYNNTSDIDIYKFQKVDTLSTFWSGFLLQNGNLFIAGRIDNKDDLNLKNLYIVEISPELEIIHENIYGIPSEYNSLSLTNLYIDSDSIVIISGTLDDPAPGWLQDLYIAKLNINGDLLDTTISTYYDSGFDSEILKKQDNSGYYLIGGCSFAELIELDNNINITGSQPMDPDNLYIGPLGVRWLANGNFIIASLAFQEVPGAFYDLRVRVSNMDLEAIKDTVIIDDGKNFLPLLNGLDFVDEDNIWVATYPQLGKSTSDWEYGRIYIFDSELNVKGAKYFGGTSSLYLYSLKALDDGGCIITGIAADPLGKGNTDVYIKKVMPDDILTHAEETPETNDMDVLVYPVPFSKELNIETYRKGLVFSLYFNNGKCLVALTQLKIPHTKINTDGLVAGYYYFTIYDNNKKIQSGKLIKQE